MKNFIQWSLLILGLTIIGAAGGTLVFLNGRTSSLGPEPRVFEVTRGMSPKEITRGLVEAGIVSHPLPFYWWAKLTGAWAKVKAAEYEFPKEVGPEQVMSILQSGMGRHYEFLVREGDNLYLVARALAERGFGEESELVALFKSKEFLTRVGLSDPELHTLEGYLAPSTYFYEKRDTVETLVKKMVQVSDRWWTELDAEYPQKKLSRHETVILASIVEKETGAASERPLIAGVFWNRLNKHMRLQSDPTTIYGIWERYDGNIRKKDLLESTPYNTYTVAALPVGPISNPGKDALRAVLQPATTDALYFVAKGDGSHVFSKTYAEHQKNVVEYQLKK